MQKLAGAILAMLVVLTGCKVPPRSGRTSSSSPASTPVTIETNRWTKPTVPPAATPSTNAQAAATAPTNPPPAKPAANEPKWQSLNRWAEQRGLGTLRRVTSGPVESFALITPAAVLTLNIGLLSARWDNLELRLGFAPQLSDGQVFVHSLDLHKNIEPLLSPVRLPPPGARVIVIDPGHGGSNTGTRSVVDGRWEKEFTLDWGARLATLLATNGWKVLLTRTNDAEVSLNERVEFAEREKADLFVSLHFNSPGNGNRDAAGLETYCLTPVGMTSSLTRGYEDNAAESFANNAFDDQNIAWAVRLHGALLRVGGVADRGVRRARFQTVLRGHNRPAVLIEGGFLSNPAEARRVADPAFRQKLAEALAEALK